MAFLALSRILYRTIYLVQLLFLFFVELYRMQLVSCILQLAIWAESLVDLPLRKNAARSDQDQQWFYAIWSLECKQFGQYVKKMFQQHHDWCWLVLWFSIHQFWLPQPMQLPSKPNLLQNAINMQGCCRKLPLGPKNNFSMAIHTQLGKANQPGWARSGPVQSQFHPSTEG